MAIDKKLQIVAAKPRDQLEQLSDDELMVLVGGGHKAPFEQLVRRHHAVVLGYATRFLGDRSLAKEIAQEVFLTAWQERDRYQAQGKFRGYLLTVAFHRCQAIVRRQRTVAKKRRDLTTQTDSPLPKPLDQLLEAERAAYLRRELSHLNDRTRQVIVLRFCNELSYEQISEVTGQRLGTVKSQVCRGIKELLARLPAEYRS